MDRTFFLDEVTAFSAGHRPCFQCRYIDHQNFKIFWLKGNPQYGFNMKTPVSCIDEIVHAERIDKNKSKVTFTAEINELPDGTFVSYNGDPYLLKDQRLFLWIAGGYSKGISIPEIKYIEILTPHSFVNMFSAGYVAQIHQSV